jgi:hypothetical protein
VAVVGSVVTGAVAGGVVGEATLRVVAGLGEPPPDSIGSSGGAGCGAFEPQPNVTASDATNTALARRIDGRKLGVIR